MTKVQLAHQIYTNNPDVSDRLIIDMFMSQLSMSLATARTYLYNIRKRNTSTNKSTDLIEKLKNECKKVLSKAEQLYQLDFSNVKYQFTTSGLCAGKAGWGNTLILSLEAAQVNWEDMVNDTIPHEIAHLVCQRIPRLGKGHDNGWKRVCVSLGLKNPTRCHKLKLTPAKQVTYHKYKLVCPVTNTVLDEYHVIGPKYHKKLQSYKSDVFYFTLKSSKKRICASNYVGPCPRPR